MYSDIQSHQPFCNVLLTISLHELTFQVHAVVTPHKIFQGGTFQYYHQFCSFEATCSTFQVLSYDAVHSKITLYYKIASFRNFAIHRQLQSKYFHQVVFSIVKLLNFNCMYVFYQALVHNYVRIIYVFVLTFLA